MGETSERGSEQRLVVVGGDAAGMSAASKVRRMQPDREIVVLERGEFTSYAACGMPYLISGEVSGPDTLVARTPEAFREEYNIDVRTLHEATVVDRAARVVHYREVETGRTGEISYGTLLLATGASPVRPDLPGMDADGVLQLSTLGTGLAMLKRVKLHPPSRVVIVGGGYIGLEMAEVFRAIGCSVHLLDMAPQVMGSMDPEMAARIVAAMERDGVTLSLGVALEGVVTRPDGGVQAVTAGGKEYPADLVVMGLGVKPNSGLGIDAGLKAGPKGSISVNETLQTSDAAIFAAGDCADSHHRVTGERTWVALGTVANKHGLVAGTNIGGGETRFPGVLGTAITRFSDVEIARTGLSEREATEAGMEVECRTIESRTRAGYMPGSESIAVKLVASPDGKLLGGQIVGGTGSGKRIDTLAAALTAGLSVTDLLWMDLAYAPPFSPVWDPVQMAARQF